MKTTRRHFSKSAGLVALWPWACSQVKPPTEGVLVNDIHSKLNPTTVSRVVEADRVEVVQATLADARHTGQSISISAGRHAMGAQQFGTRHGTARHEETQTGAELRSPRGAKSRSKPVSPGRT